MASSTARRFALAIVALTFVACAHRAGPADEAPPSVVLQDVYFTNILTPGSRSYWTINELGPRVRRFNPGQDDKLVLIMVFNPRYTVNVTAALFRPDGRQHGTFQEHLDSRPTGTWQTIRRWWSIDSLRPWPGQWHVKVWVDGTTMGRYHFLLGPEPQR
jgi:hypothetical protein